MGLTSSDSEQVSLYDFLESYRAGAILAELEEDDELPEPAEDANEDDEGFDERTEEKRDFTGERRHVTNSKRRSWDDELVLKRQFSALVPAFDPRPRRTNVNQTSKLEIPPPGPLSGVVTGAEAITPKAASAAIVSPVASSTTAEADLVPQPQFHSTLRGPSILNEPDGPDVEADLTDNDQTVFQVDQKLVHSSTLSNRYNSFFSLCFSRNI